MDRLLVNGIEPRLVKRARGGWLALTKPELELRIGVTGETESEARQLFAAVIARWDRAREVDPAI